jgi:hypothetical protein
MRAGAKDVERTLGRTAELLHDVRIDHRRLDMRVTEVLLNLPDIDAVEQDVRCEAVWRNVCTEIGLWILARVAATLTAFWMTESLRWCRRTMPARGSVDNV